MYFVGLNKQPNVVFLCALANQKWTSYIKEKNIILLLLIEILLCLQKKRIYIIFSLLRVGASTWAVDLNGRK